MPSLSPRINRLAEGNTSPFYISPRTRLQNTSPFLVGRRAVIPTTSIKVSQAIQSRPKHHGSIQRTHLSLYARSSTPFSVAVSCSRLVNEPIYNLRSVRVYRRVKHPLALVEFPRSSGLSAAIVQSRGACSSICACLRSSQRRSNPQSTRRKTVTGGTPPDRTVA
jgi:hypothetical protein